MKKKIIKITLFLILLGCGTNSEIDPLVSSSPLGKDGQIKKTFLYPLTEDSILRYEDPTLDDGMFIKWLNKATYNIASALGFGKVRIELSEKVPEIDHELVSEVSIKKIFLNIEEVPCTPELKEEKKCRMKDYSFRKDRKKKKQNFDFLNSFTVNLEKNPSGIIYTTDQKNNSNNSQEPQESDDYDVSQVSKSDYDKLNTNNDPNTIKIASYDKENDTGIKLFYTNYIIIKNNNSFLLKQYIKSKKHIIQSIKSIHSTKGYLYVELKENDFDQVKFIYFLSSEGVGNIAKIEEVKDCKKNNCLVLNVNKSNLVEFLKNEKNVFIQIYIDLQKVPTKMFQIRGYILGETTINLNI